MRGSSWIAVLAVGAVAVLGGCAESTDAPATASIELPRAIPSELSCDFDQRHMMVSPFRAHRPEGATTPEQAAEEFLPGFASWMVGWTTDYVLSPDLRTAWVLREDGSAIAALRIKQFGRYYAMDGYEACTGG